MRLSQGMPSQGSTVCSLATPSRLQPRQRGGVCLSRPVTCSFLGFHLCLASPRSPAGSAASLSFQPLGSHGGYGLVVPGPSCPVQRPSVPHQTILPSLPTHANPLLTHYFQCVWGRTHPGEGQSSPTSALVKGLFLGPGSLICLAILGSWQAPFSKAWRSLPFQLQGHCTKASEAQWFGLHAGFSHSTLQWFLEPERGVRDHVFFKGDPVVQWVSMGAQSQLCRYTSLQPEHVSYLL